MSGFKMYDIVVATWTDYPLVKDQTYRVIDVSRTDGQIRSYRLDSPTLREDVWIGGDQIRALRKVSSAEPQKNLMRQGHVQLRDGDETILNLLFGPNPITDAELRALIAKRPATYARFAVYLGKRPGK